MMCALSSITLICSKAVKWRWKFGNENIAEISHKAKQHNTVWAFPGLIHISGDPVSVQSNESYENPNELYYILFYLIG